MKLVDRITKMGFTLIEETPDGLVFKRDKYNKFIIVTEGDKLKYEHEIRLFKLWKEKDWHPFVAMSNGKFFDLIFDDILEVI